VKDLKVQDVKQIIQEIVDIQLDKINYKSIDVQQHFVGFSQSSLIKTDIKRLQQVFLNILSNAIKFTDRDGKIMIIVEKKDNQFMRIAVRDNGIGIKERHKKRLFKLFGSIKSEKKNLNI
jgi:CheY-like chemotaxis protein/anti-sigma regulatory factor (Ser/Thr protein kinase)